MKTELPRVTETIPVDWSAEEELLAKDALAILHRMYPRWKWGVEFTEATSDTIGCMVIRLMDVLTEVVSVINPRDFDKPNLTCVMRAGGLLLEALGFRVGGKRDKVSGGLLTPSGLILPAYDSIRDGNPGYESIKRQYKNAR